MLKVRLCCFLFSYCCIACLTFSCAGEVTDEMSALLSTKASLVDPLNSLRDWKFVDRSSEKNAAHCNWTGVGCNAVGAVEKLDLSHMNLSGRISDEIHRLKHLTTLNLCCNDFSSSLPNFIANLTTLQTIDVSQNYFTGDFPIGLGSAPALRILNASGNNFSGFLPKDIGNATSLELLDLRGCFFQGSIPKVFKTLQQLKFLGLSGNNLTGEIPRELGQISSLESLILGYNEFEGGIPTEFGNLTNLKYLDLAVANLNGEIPAELGKLQLLETVFLYKNNIRGRIPATIGNMTSLLLLDLSDNMLSGHIPIETSRLKNLQLLNLMSNQLTGSIPPGFEKLTQLEVLELWNNSLSGPLPVDLGKYSPLQWLDISSNSFFGKIPQTLCDKGNLTKLILFNNALSGSIPASLSACLPLVRVRIQNNLLSGTIPLGLGKLRRLQRLELADNRLTGQIPDDITSSTSLAFVDISRNNLHSSLPSTIFAIPSLQSFIASDNNLIGKIPDQFQDCPSLSILDLSFNHLSGSIPASIASCQKLVTLNLKSNLLTGEIPTVITMMPTLAELDLSNNSLTGGIPETLGLAPALETLNVSYNKLEGPVPANGVLRTINPTDLVGNTALCGGVLQPCGRSSPFTANQRSLCAKRTLTGWIIGASSLLAVGIAIFGVRSLYLKWYTRGGCFVGRFGKNDEAWPWRLMAFQRLDFTSADILDSIKESNIIGMGATGIVYKADTQRSDSVVAVKKLWRSSGTSTDIESGSSEDLIGEVNLLGKLRHRNIVRLLGLLHNSREVMIIYEYMSNGNLGDALQGKQAGSLLIDWVSRYNIALGVAQGLAYLHHDCHPPIIHRDIKPNNILLDIELEARIADFGLARTMIRKNDTVSMVAGSYGYIAPEYGYTLKVDEKIDIYSFGVVLLELLTGKRPLDPEFGESVEIVEWIRRKIRENTPLETVLDHTVGNCRHVQEEMLLVLGIALVCTSKLPKERPSMRDVITMLGEAKPRRKSRSDGQGLATTKETPVLCTSPANDLL